MILMGNFQEALDNWQPAASQPALKQRGADGERLTIHQRAVNVSGTSQRDDPTQAVEREQPRLPAPLGQAERCG